MAVAGSVFQGVTTAPCRDFVATEIMKLNAKTVYMPCAGRFGSAQAYVNHGGEKKNLHTSDICLYSSMLGCLFDPRKSFEELGIKNNSQVQPRSKDMVEIAAAAMMAIKTGQVEAKSQYGMNLRQEILFNKERYLDKAAERIKKEVDKLACARKIDAKEKWRVLELLGSALNTGEKER